MRGYRFIDSLSLCVRVCVLALDNIDNGCNQRIVFPNVHLPTPFSMHHCGMPERKMYARGKIFLFAISDDEAIAWRQVFIPFPRVSVLS